MANHFIDTKQPVEILAPCGTIDTFHSAINAGCDACYLAGDMFGARAYAGNFSKNELLDAIDLAHLYDVKVYLTVNTLLKNSEISSLYNYLLPYYEEGLDAVIVQDMGVMKFIKEEFPGLNIHASTQMNCMSHYSAQYIKNLGLSRIVTAREMSATEIKKISDSVDIEIETFVHGALCYCYSGRCLLSSLAGGRSGNRGTCAQPCRKKYNGTYSLSMKDLCSVTEIPELIEAGITSFKIEGRMKNEYYVAAAVDAYKQLTTDYYDDCFSMEKALKYKLRLADIFNRGGFTDGYFFMRNGRNMLDETTPGHKGVKIGKIINIKGGGLEIKLSKDLSIKDVLKVKTRDNDEIELTSNVNAKSGCVITLNAKKTKLIDKNTDVYRMQSKDTVSYVDSILERKRLVDVFGTFFIAKNQPISLTLSIPMYDDLSVTVLGVTAEEAKSKGISSETIKEKLSKMGGTNYNLFSIDIFNDDESFIPLSALNELRRLAVEELTKEIILVSSRKMSDVSSYSEPDGEDTDKPVINHSAPNTPNKNTTLSFSAINMASYEYLIKTKEILSEFSLIYIDMAVFNKEEYRYIFDSIKTYNKSIYVKLPHIMRCDDFFDKEWLIDAINSSDGIYIRCIDELAFIIKHSKTLSISGKEIVFASSMYSYNDSAISFFSSIPEFSECQITFDASRELNIDEMKKLAYPETCQVEMMYYGRDELMISHQCAKCKKGENQVILLQDDKGNKFYQKSICGYCYNVLYNCDVFCSYGNEIQRVNRYRFDFTFESNDEILEVLQSYKEMREPNRKICDVHFTKGHLQRGI